MPVSLAKLRSNEAAALATDKKGAATIDKTEAKQLVTDAGKDTNNLDALRDMLARDAFEPGARAIIQAAVDKNKKIDKSDVAGMQVGTLPGKVNVTVTKELGDPKGYKNEFEAIGFARASGEKNTAVVKVDGRWHAVQTNVEPAGKGFTAAKAGSLIVPTAPTTQAEMDALKQTAKSMEATSAANPDNKELRKAADNAWRLMVGRTMGVDPATINIIRDGAEPKPDAINFSPTHTRSEAYFGNKDGNAERLPSNDKDKGTRSPHGIVLGPLTFRSPEHAAGVLAHEATHKEHHDLANEMLATFRGAKKQDFSTWITKQGLAPDMVDAIREQNGASSTSPHGAASSEVGAYAAEIMAVASRFAPDGTEMKKAQNTLKDKWSNMTRKGQLEVVEKLVEFAKTLPEDKKAKLQEWAQSLPILPCGCGKKPCTCK